MSSTIIQYRRPYLLPCHPSFKVLDRFSILPDEQANKLLDDSGCVSFWPLLKRLLTQSVHNETHANPSELDQDSTAIPQVTDLCTLASLLDTITLTVRGTAHPARVASGDENDDYRLLREAIETRFDSGERFAQNVWPRLVRLALEMKTLFPTGNIPVLGARISFDRSGSRVFPVPDGAQSSGNEQSTKIGNEDTICLSRRQAACLVVHQFLRTLRAPEWKDEEDGFHDFGLWYSGAGQRQESAAKAYLAALMAYFDEVVCHLDNPDREWSISYTLRSVETADVTNLFSPSWWLAELDVEVVEQYDTSPYSLGLPGGAAVVAANRFIGFGQSATQEEVHVGSTPEACPAVLFTPPLSDKQVLIVRGAQGMLNITGARRNIRVEPLPTPDGGMRAWSERTMLFMDALELDMTDPAAGLPDALPENVDRELVKAYAAFSYLEPLQHVRTGLWGCGAFGGDPGIKMVVLWLAACLAGTRLVVVCDEAQREFAEHLQSFVTAYKRITGSSIHLWALIRSLPPTVSRGETLRWVCSQVEARAYNFLRT